MYFSPKETTKALKSRGWNDEHVLLGWQISFRDGISLLIPPKFNIRYQKMIV